MFEMRVSEPVVAGDRFSLGPFCSRFRDCWAYIAKKLEDIPFVIVLSFVLYSYPFR